MLAKLLHPVLNLFDQREIRVANLNVKIYYVNQTVLSQTMLEHKSNLLRLIFKIKYQISVEVLADVIFPLLLRDNSASKPRLSLARSEAENLDSLLVRGGS